MSRIQTPATVNDAPLAAQDVLSSVKHSLGSVPNMHRILSNSPAALKGYVYLNDALGTGSLDPATRERIALALAELNDCDYCRAAHGYVAQSVTHLTRAEIIRNREGSSTDVKSAAAVKFAVDIAKSRGKIDPHHFETLQTAGFSPSDIVEIIAHVAMNTLTNYVNVVLGTDIDFPLAESLAA